jgi:hypothetical protein
MSSVFIAIGTALASAGAAMGLGAAATGAAAAGAATATGVGAAGAATAGAAATGAATVTLSQVLSAGSALAAIGQGFAANAQAKTQAAFARAEATQEEAAGAARTRDLAKEYAELRGEQTVIQLANGLDIGVGTPVNIADATRRQADRNVSVTRENTRNRSRMARLRSRGLLSEGKASLAAGFGKAAGIGADSFQLTG